MERRRAVIVLIAILLVACWSHVYMVSCIAFTYLYWSNPTLQCADATTSSGVNDEFPVPKILHQTWKTKDLPDKWKQAQRSCIDLHPDYEYRFWTDDDALQLIKEHFPWFLPTYLSYPYNIQRVDAVRYFILLKFGGIYMDLDMGCRKKAEFLRKYNFTAPLTYPIGLSNDVMASRPGDLFLKKAVEQLPRWNHWLFIKYVQVMFGTGPMFLTVQYALASNRLKRDVAAIPQPVYGKYDFTGNAAFYHLHGSSWHANDAKLVFWLDKYKTVLIVVGGLAALTVGVAVVGVKRRTYGGIHYSRDSFDIEKSF